MVAAIGSICICEIIDDGDDDSDDFFHFDWQGFWVMAYGVWLVANWFLAKSGLEL